MIKSRASSLPIWPPAVDLGDLQSTVCRVMPFVPPLYLSIRRQICPGPLNHQFSKLSGFRDDVALAKFLRLGSCLKIVMVIT
jgi:hypothetical protein